MSFSENPRKYVVNFFATNSKDSYLGKTIARLGLALGERYFMSDRQALDYFVRGTANEGQTMFIQYLKEEHGITAIPFRFEGHSEVYAYGYVIDDSPGLVAALLELGYPADPE